MLLPNPAHGWVPASASTFRPSSAPQSAAAPSGHSAVARALPGCTAAAACLAQRLQGRRARRQKALATRQVVEAPIRVVELPNRGKAVVATEAIAAGTLVAFEEPLLRFKFCGDAALDIKEVAEAFASLPPEGQSAVLGLCEAEVSSTGLQAALHSLQVADPELWRLARVIDCNLYGIDNAVQQEGEALCALYELCSRFNHSCFPNLRRSFLETGQIQLRTVRSVEPDEELTVSYLGEQALLQSISHRRWRLKCQWGFDCDCPRCALSDDPARGFLCRCGGTVLAGPSHGSDLEGRACQTCGSRVEGEDAAEGLRREERALVALELYALAEGNGSVAKLQEELTAAQEPGKGALAPTHWAVGMLHHSMQQSLRQSGRFQEALPHLEAKLHFLDAVYPGPLLERERDREAWRSLRSAAQSPV